MEHNVPEQYDALDAEETSADLTETADDALEADAVAEEAEESGQ